MKRLFGHWIAPVMALALVAATCAQAQSLKVASPQRGGIFAIGSFHGRSQ